MLELRAGATTRRDDARNMSILLRSMHARLDSVERESVEKASEVRTAVEKVRLIEAEVTSMTRAVQLKAQADVLRLLRSQEPSTSFTTE